MPVGCYSNSQRFSPEQVQDSGGRASKILAVSKHGLERERVREGWYIRYNFGDAGGYKRLGGGDG